MYDNPPDPSALYAYYLRGIDPRTYRMQSESSTVWATSP